MLHILHLVGQFIALHVAQHRFILSPEFWRRTAASVGPEAAPHLMELSPPNQTLTVNEILGSIATKQVFLRRRHKISTKTKYVLHLVLITAENLLQPGFEPGAA